MAEALLETSLKGLPVRRGKVRDVYDLGGDRLLFVATDRISDLLFAPSPDAVDNLRSPLIALLFVSTPDKAGIALLGLASFGLIALLIVACGGLKPFPDPA